MAKKADKIEVVGLVVEALPYTQFWSSWKTATASWRTLPARCAKYFSAFCWGGGARRDELYDHTRSISTLPRKASARIDEDENLTRIIVESSKLK